MSRDTKAGRILFYVYHHVQYFTILTFHAVEDED